MTAVYTYVTVDLLSNRVLAEVPFGGVSFSKQLNNVGSFTGTFPLLPELANLELKDSTIPGRTAVYVLRDNKIVWGGIIWKRRYDPKALTVQCDASTFGSYLYKRFQLKTKFFDDEDQIDIARYLFNELYNVQLVDGAIGMELDVDTMSGVIRDRTMFDYEYKTLGEELDQLANLINGFEYSFDPYFKSDGSFGRKLNFGYPFLGIPIDHVSSVFDYPGNITTWTIDEDAQSSADVEYTIGAGEGEEQLFDVAINAEYQVNGYPVIEDSTAYKSVLSPSTLRAHGLTNLSAKLPPITVFSLTVRGDADPQVGTYDVGDWVLIRISDPWFGNMHTFQRIGQLSVTAPSDSQEEVVALTVGTDIVQRTDDSDDSDL